MRTKEEINTLEAQNRAGEKRIWQYYWDKIRSIWVLRTDSEIEIELEKNWLDSKPIINLILSNHGLRAKL